jgi:hypothetical protein
LLLFLLRDAGFTGILHRLLVVCVEALLPHRLVVPIVRFGTSTDGLLIPVLAADWLFVPVFDELLVLSTDGLLVPVLAADWLFFPIVDWLLVLSTDGLLVPVIIPLVVLRGYGLIVPGDALLGSDGLLISLGPNRLLVILIGFRWLLSLFSVSLAVPFDDGEEQRFEPTDAW